MMMIRIQLHLSVCCRQCNKISDFNLFHFNESVNIYISKNHAVWVGKHEKVNPVENLFLRKNEFHQLNALLDCGNKK